MYCVGCALQKIVKGGSSLEKGSSVLDDYDSDLLVPYLF